MTFTIKSNGKRSLRLIGGKLEKSNSWYNVVLLLILKSDEDNTLSLTV